MVKKGQIENIGASYIEPVYYPKLNRHKPRHRRIKDQIFTDMSGYLFRSG